LYDGDGNRVAESANGITTQYLVDNVNPTGLPQVVDELLGGSVSKTYTYGVQRISQDQPQGNTGTPSFYGYDAHGSVRLLTSSAGAVTDTYSYDAFGTRLTCSGSTFNDFQYSGEQVDALLGHYYMRARYYNVGTGRFLTMDPEFGDTSNPTSLHRYLYASGDPVNRIDPTGRQDLEEYVTLLEAVQAEADFIKKFVKCEFVLLKDVNNALTDAFNGLAVSPDAGPQAVLDFANCLYDELLSPQAQIQNLAEYLIGEQITKIWLKIIYDIVLEIYHDYELFH